MRSSQLNQRSTTSDDIQSTPASWFDQLCSIFEEASKSVGGMVSRYFQIDRVIIRVRFAGPAMVPLIWPAFEHLAADPTLVPDLTVLVWDSLSTETVMPSPPWTTDAYKSRGHIDGYNDGRIFTNVDTGLSLLRMLDTERDIGLFWCRDTSLVPQHETAAPLRTILSWWLSPRGLQLAHCAAVGKIDGGALLVGKGGSGKSTTALLCLGSDLEYVGDDFCVIFSRGKQFVHSLYNTAKINHDNLLRIPARLRAGVDNLDSLEEKSIIFMHQNYPEKMAIGFPVRVIIVPRVSKNKNTIVRPASPATTLRALAPSSLFLRPDSGHRAFREMASLVKSVPAFHLELGTELEQIPIKIEHLLAEVDS